MRSMYDVLYLPAATPVGYDVAAGYVASTGISHAWSVADWNRAKVSARYLLPIAGGSLYGGTLTPEQDARDALARCPFGFPKGAALALDVEQYKAQEAKDTGYVDRWASTVARLGYVPVIYCSGSTAHLFGGWALWTASWTGTAHLDNGAVATQWTSPTFNPALDVDISTVADVLALWDTRAPAPPPRRKRKDMYIVNRQGKPAAIVTGRAVRHIDEGDILKQFTDQGVPSILCDDDASYHLLTAGDQLS